MKRSILDLRFIIGLFFGLAGLILVIGSFSMQAGSGKSETTNLWSGIVYIAFGVLMVLLWFFGKHENEQEEEIEKETNAV